jgi:hypothetical protein
MSQRAHPLPHSSPSPPTKPPFFSTLEDLWRWQLAEIGPPESWPADEREELEPFYRMLRARLGLTD